MKSMIQVKNLKKFYRVGDEKVKALNGIDLTIERGEICCILGTSGSGKSTLLNMLAGLEPPTRGEIWIDSLPIHSMGEKALTDFRRESVGFVFQSYNLIASLPAWANVAMPLEFRGTSKKERENLARKMLAAVNTPSEMSGGQQQRVGIARAFVHRPKLVFADEPTGNLDSKTTIEVMELMVSMARQHRQTLIIVTHDPEIADYADRIIHLIDGKIHSDRKNQPCFYTDFRNTNINSNNEGA